MKSRDFCFWLQGFFEVGYDGSDLGFEKVEMIKKHLALVFAHEIDPPMGNVEQQIKLNLIHNEPIKMRC